MPDGIKNGSTNISFSGCISPVYVHMQSVLTSFRKKEQVFPCVLYEPNIKTSLSIIQMAQSVLILVPTTPTWC